MLGKPFCCSVWRAKIEKSLIGLLNSWYCDVIQTTSIIKSLLCMDGPHLYTKSFLMILHQNMNVLDHDSMSKSLKLFSCKTKFPSYKMT